MWMPPHRQPGEEAAEPELADLRDGLGLADDGHRAFVAVGESGRPAGDRAAAAGKPRFGDRLARIAAHLDAALRHAGHWLPVSADLAAAMSPTTKTSGWPGIVRSAPTTTRPSRSSGTPSDWPQRTGPHSGRPEDVAHRDEFVADIQSLAA